MVSALATYTIENAIALITIHNPPMNTLTIELRDQLRAIFDELNAEKDKVRVVIIMGSGKAFMAGADIKSFPELSQAKAKLRLKKSRQLYLRIEQFERPIICAINGYCLGAGLELAMCCDIRIACPRAQLGQPEINVGVIPGGGGTQRLPRLIGEGRAKELIYTAKFISAEEAKQIGLVNKVVDSKRLLEEAMEMASLIATKPSLAISAAKKSISLGLDMTLLDGLKLESQHWAELCGTEDQKEGAKAFIEKRKPVFRGR
jgi:enoyl-CoA hydratase